MNRNLLHSFFDGKSTLEDEKQIRGWIEASEANKKIFNEERLIFDTLNSGTPAYFRFSSSEYELSFGAATK